ncbi:RrF2 family transcriptional regulator [Tannockella kyphosi]|uniref:RrF2 family transcriptional regulator n=1 Tax=Tannockella kyphosi TaxID=2899121 RepID=UPI00201185A6|nr:Rrf2 family transcriptional regulator [Tannockella kyphosi]
MKVSTRGRYALRFMIYLARHNEEKRVSLKDVAKEEDISVKYLEHIVTQLSRANMVASSRGAKGGYCLVKPAEEYLVGEVLEVVEGSLSPVACIDLHDCNREVECRTCDLWKGLKDVIYDYLNSYTLQDLADKKQESIC